MLYTGKLYGITHTSTLYRNCYIIRVQYPVFTCVAHTGLIITNILDTADKISGEIPELILNCYSTS
jgi:hypothetical protein